MFQCHWIFVVIAFFQVLEIKAEKRTGELSFYTCVRKVLEDHYGTKPVGLGGTFLLKRGRAKVHVMVSSLLGICYEILFWD